MAGERPSASDGADSTSGQSGPAGDGPARAADVVEAERSARATLRSHANGRYGVPPDHANGRDSGAGPSAQFQYDAWNSGVAGSSVPERVTEQWSTRLEPGIQGGLAVGDDAVYVTDRGAAVALDADDGTELWRSEVGHALDGVPAADGDAVYVPAWNGGEDRERGLVALDAADGSELWRAVPDVGVSRSPTVVSDAVGPGGSSGATGKSSGASGDSSGASGNSSDPSGATVFVGGSIESEEVIAVDAASGAVEWRFEAGQYATTPAVADGVAYVGGGSEPVAYALDAATGEERWRYEASDRVWGAPTVADGLVYVTTRDGQVTVLSADGGDVEWSTSVGEVVSVSPAVTDEAVYVPTDEALVALSRDGEELWSADRPSASAPTVAGDALVATDTEELFALDLEDGSERWSGGVPERLVNGTVYLGIRSPPAVRDGTVYVGSLGGDVVAFDALE